MKIVIFGSTGMAGSTISKYLKLKHNIVEINRQQFNVLSDKIPTIDCDYAVNCIGIIKQKTNKDIYNINYNFVKKLSEKYKVINISTDCVFSGNKKTKYKKYDLKDASDDYGISKSLSETTDVMSIRTSIIGPSKDNFGLFEWFKSQKECYGFTNHIWSGMTTLELAKFIDYIISNNMFKIGVTQISTTPITKYNLLNLINFIFNMNKIIYPKESNYINRSMESDYKIKSIIDQLEELKRF